MPPKSRHNVSPPKVSIASSKQLYIEDSGKPDWSESVSESDLLLPSPSTKKSHKMNKKDFWNIILLVNLYLLQGVPLGLTFGSIPFLLKSKLSYADIALFSLSGYPYSLKLFWSPIVDSIYLKSIGRRKSWIVPIQAITGLFLLWLGGHIDEILKREVIPVKMLVIAFTCMVFLCATQDIAVDGWALTLLSEENKQYASTAQTIGLNTGYFLSFTVFLALNSKEFCNVYLRSTPLDYGILQLGSYLQFWGVAFLLCDMWLIFLTREDPVKPEEELGDITTVYKTIYRVCLLPQMTRFIIILLIAKIGFVANEAVTGLKLLEFGYQKEDLALGVLIDFPFQLLFGYYAAKWSSGKRPLKPWIYGFYGRLIAAVFGLILVNTISFTGPTRSMFYVVLFSIVFRSFAGTVQFVSIGSFFTKISDPAIGGTYMTLLNTIANLGGTWPNFFVLKAVDYFTDATCILPEKKPSNPPQKEPSTNLTDPSPPIAAKPLSQRILKRGVDDTKSDPESAGKKNLPAPSSSSSFSASASMVSPPAPIDIVEQEIDVIPPAGAEDKPEGEVDVVVGEPLTSKSGDVVTTTSDSMSTSPGVKKAETIKSEKVESRIEKESESGNLASGAVSSSESTKSTETESVFPGVEPVVPESIKQERQDLQSLSNTDEITHQSSVTRTVEPTHEYINRTMKNTITTPFRCTDEHTKTLCLDHGGTCEVRQDGYYPVSAVSITLGILLMVFVIRPGVEYLESLPEQSWRLSGSVSGGAGGGKKKRKGRKDGKSGSETEDVRDTRDTEKVVVRVGGGGERRREKYSDSKDK
ncbi:hypothetical protein HK098_006260 [Nowakowskiella sp. JEL0407]|nr:hypothetical protein HK098_006260 [Nowakowskiella sp. JEL0407]